MGIRYYAYPVAPELVDLAREEPRLFLSPDPLADAWGPPERCPEMLYLDKCWHWLQRLTTRGDAPRPAYRLFEGGVRFVDGGAGWHAWERVLGPDEVEAVAADIVLLGEEDVRATVRRWSPDHGRSVAEEMSYVMQFLGAAQHFAVATSRAGRGIVYTIG